MADEIDHNLVRADAERILAHFKDVSERLAKFEFVLDEARTIEEVAMALGYWGCRLGELMSVIEAQQKVVEEDKKRQRRKSRG